MDLKTFTDNFHLLADTPNGIPKLREMILQLAIMGKLVPQHPNDEPASVLLEKIAKEKERLVSEGKIKKPKPLPPIDPDEVPCELPKGWQWVRSGDVTSYGITERVEPGGVKEGTWTLELQDIEKTTSKLLVRVRFPERDFRSTKNRFDRGDVLYGKLRPYLDKVLVADEPGVCTTEIMPVHGYSNTDPFYLRYVLKSNYFITYASSMTHGMNLPRLGTDKARLALIPLPPLPEQKHIVAKVDELMAICDKLEEQKQKREKLHINMNKTCLHALTSPKPMESKKGWTRIRNSFDLLYDTPKSVAELRQSILQLAVMGKLVPQDPKDEPASILLQKIAKEKERRIAEGKLKKQKPLPPVDPDDVPYELPEGWEWCRLGTLGLTQTGTTPSKSKREYFGKGYPFVKPADISEAGVMYGREELTEAGLAAGRFIPYGSAMMVCIGGSIGKVGYVERDCSCNQQINALTPYGGVNGKFLAYWMKSPLFQQQVLCQAPQTTLPILSKGKWEQLILPTPPRAEQVRILRMINTLLPLCDSLIEKISQANVLGEELMSKLTNRPIIQSLLGLRAFSRVERSIT